MQAAAERTLRWAERCRRAHTRADQALFGIVQGGIERGAAPEQRGAHGLARLRRLRARRPRPRRGARAPRRSRARGARRAAGRGAALPDGHRTAARICVAAIDAGVDLFDCVLPTRHARHGVLYTSQGTPAPAQRALSRRPRAARPRLRLPRLRVCIRGPTCTTCCAASEALGARLASLHNLRFYLRLLASARRAIAEGGFRGLRAPQRGAGRPTERPGVPAGSRSRQTRSDLAFQRCTSRRRGGVR